MVLRGVYGTSAEAVGGIRGGRGQPCYAPTTMLLQTNAMILRLCSYAPLPQESEWARPGPLCSYTYAPTPSRYAPTPMLLRPPAMLLHLCSYALPLCFYTYAPMPSCYDPTPSCYDPTPTLLRPPSTGVRGGRGPARYAPTRTA
eukprot:473169-Rhodomonas_salina.2